MMKFNINNYVKVVLTDVGHEELKRQHNELRKSFPNVPEFTEPKVDEDGYTIFQMHELMNTLGHLCVNGFDVPFQPTIIITD